MGQAYDYLIFRWDRYVLSYGFFDQVGLARKLATWWGELWDSDRSKNRADSEDSTSLTERFENVGSEDLRIQVGLEAIVPLAVLVLIAAYWVWRHRPAFSAMRAYRRLRSDVERRESPPVPASLPPLRLADRIDELHPPASGPARRIIELYLRESFGGQELTETEIEELRTALREALQYLRKTA